MRGAPPGKRGPNLVKRRPLDPDAKPWAEWSFGNQHCFESFRKWLQQTSASPHTIALYSAAVRWVLAYLDLPYWTLDPQVDVLERAGEHIRSLCDSPATWESYHKGLLKFSEFLHYAYHRPLPEKQVNWEYHTGSLPEWLRAAVREYITHRQRAWSLEKRFLATTANLSSLTRFLRWAVGQTVLETAQDLTVKLWHTYMDERLQQGILPVSLNRELFTCQNFLRFLRELGQPVNERLLRLPLPKKKRCLPRDVPLEKLRLLLAEIERNAASLHAGVRRTGLLDRATFLLMLHCGLRTCEIRFMRQSDILWERRSLHIEQSKGLKDRTVYLSQPVIEALQAYLLVRGPAGALPEQVFIYRHKPLSPSYFYERLQTYAKRCGVRITPHQLRHSAATLLLNAGATVSTVQAILGHRWMSTTMRYIRVYDQTVAADYYRAMAVVERRLQVPLQGDEELSLAQMLTLLDALGEERLDAEQLAVLQQLRRALLARMENDKAI